MSRVIGFVLLAVIVVVGAILLFRRKKPKGPCEQALNLGEKTFDAYYKTNTSTIIGDEQDASLCALLDSVAVKASEGAAAVVSSKYGKAGLTALSQPSNVVSAVGSGDVQGTVGALTGADVVSELIGGNRPLSALSCSELSTNCGIEKTQFGNPTNFGGKGPNCTEFGRRCRTGTADHGDTAVATARPR